MRIRTITCHEVYNYGASLQEYALIKFLKENGFDASAINYKPPYLSGHFNLKAVSNPKFDKPIIKLLYLAAKFPGRLISLKKKKKFDAFHKKYIPTDLQIYRSNIELSKNLPEADIFICGSDQIWNSYFESGKDPAFYLNFVPKNKKKISYAASFAIEELPESVKPLVKENVVQMDAIGVRETSGVRILNELGVYNAVQVLDPVFLVDIEHWQEFTSPINDNYIFVYDFDSSPIIKDIALTLRKEKGWKIYSLNQNINYADRNFWLEGPEKFLSLVLHSQINVTNSFHSTAFSLIFEKQLVVVNRFDKINTRMRDLLDLMGIGNYLISSTAQFMNLPKIDFSSVVINRDIQIQRSKSFLLTALQ